jgi:hypothetical protein
MVAAIETGLEESQLGFMLDGRPMDLDKTLEALSVKNGDMVVIARRGLSTPQSGPESASGPNEAEHLRQYILNDEPFQAQLGSTNPALLDAALTNSPRFPDMVRQLQTQLGGQSQIEAEKAALYVSQSTSALS